jgi:type IV pilus assembly protein PilA
MNNKRGFTLVELLAVIVILAIILVIAIPNVIKVIDKARLDTYKRNEDMLINATQKYLVSNGIVLTNVGDTTTINYSQLQDDKLIDKITDQTSNVECNKSNVKITKTTNGYTYTPVLLCDNYINLERYNLVSNYDFTSGTTGWNGLYGTTVTSNNGIMTVTGNGSVVYPQTSISMGSGKVGPSQKMYIRVKARATNSLALSISIMINQTVTTSQAMKNPLVMNEWYDVSKIVTLNASTGTGNANFYLHTNYSTIEQAAGNSLEYDYVYVINLTYLYGAGNEPTDPTVIDNMINKSR